MRRPGGYGLVIGPDGNTEVDTFTCVHDQRVVRVPPGASPVDCGGWCGRCGAPICLECAKLGTCTPFEEKLERYEARQRSLQSMGL